MAGFIKNWVRKNGETVPNADLWKRFLAPAGTASGYIQLAAGHETAIWKMNAVMSLRAIVPPEKICQPTPATKGALAHPV